MTRDEALDNAGAAYARALKALAAKRAREAATDEHSETVDLTASQNQQAA
jgi:hypothetical protein